MITFNLAVLRWHPHAEAACLAYVADVGGLGGTVHGRQPEVGKPSLGEVGGWELGGKLENV